MCTVQLPSLTLVPHDVCILRVGGWQLGESLVQYSVSCTQCHAQLPNNDAIKIVSETRNESLEMLA